MALSRTLLTSTNDPPPSLMVGACVVLAPDVNLFLNSCKQMYLCWCSQIENMHVTFVLYITMVYYVIMVMMSHSDDETLIIPSCVRECNILQGFGDLQTAKPNPSRPNPSPSKQWTAMVRSVSPLL